MGGFKGVIESLDAETIAAITAAGTTIVSGVLQWWKGRKAPKEGPERVVKVDVTTAAAFGALVALGATSGAKRSLVLEAVKTEAGKWRSSVILEAYDSRASAGPIVGKWQDQIVDDDYSEMLARMDVRGHVTNVTSELAEDSTLRAVYDSMGVHWSYVWTIGETKDSEGRRALVYGSLSFADPHTKETESAAALQDAVRVATSKLAVLFGLQDE